MYQPSWRTFASRESKAGVPKPHSSPTEFLPGEERILRVPPNVNSWKLGKLLDEDPLEILDIIQTQTNEIVTDEF